MVQKGEKATEVRLPVGPISTTELTELLDIAWADSEGWLTSAKLRWKDGHTASVRDQAELDTIEDAPGVTMVSGYFRYTDGSSLDLTISRYLGASTSATGATARQRQTRIAQLWATFPRRSGLPPRVAGFLSALHWPFIVGAVAGISVNLILDLTVQIQSNRPSLAIWLSEVGLLVLGMSLWSYDRVSPHGQHERHPIVYHRNDSSWQRVVGTASPVIGFGSLLMAIVAWFYPRK